MLFSLVQQKDKLILQLMKKLSDRVVEIIQQVAKL